MSSETRAEDAYCGREPVYAPEGFRAIYIVMRYNCPMSKNLQTKDRQRLRNLADFRYELRRFLHFSEGRAAEAGLHPQQHQLMLQLAGAPDGVETTVSYAAERLGLRHHTVVELSKRCEEAGLIHRDQDMNDRRCIQFASYREGPPGAASSVGRPCPRTV
jgi:hypothetical protein